MVLWLPVQAIVIKSSTGKVKVEAVGVEITSQADVKIQANTNISMQASADC